MTDLDDRIARLSPAKQALLRQLAGQQVPDAQTAPTIPRRPPDAAPAPLSFAQQRLWFLDQLEPGTARYHICRRFQLAGPLDVGRLVAALDALVARHAILRTTFELRDHAAVQVIAPARSLGVALEDLSRHAPEHRAAQVDAIAAGEARRPFDLAREPGFRVRLLRLAAHDHALVVALHHAVADGWSLGVWQRELIALYRDPAALPAPAVGYVDYADWQRGQATTPAFHEAVAFWRDELAGAPILDLPADRARPAIATSAGAVHRHVLPVDLTEGVRAVARREASTPFMILLAAWQAVLHRLTGERDLVIGTPVANRSRVELEGVIGCITNTVALRTQLAGALSFRELVGRVRASCARAFGHQHVPFEAVVEAVKPDRSLAHSPLFQVMFSLTRREPDAVDVEPSGPASPGLRMTRTTLDTGAAAFELTLLVEDTGDRFEIEAEYLREVFEPDTIARWLDSYGHLLAAVIADPELRLDAAPLLGAEQARWLRQRAGHALCEVAPGAALAPVHDQIARIAAATPDAIALEDPGQPISFRELDERANRLARTLTALGVGREAVVGVIAARSCETAIALLGVLKAGAAYLPIDAASPADRIARLLADARVAALVCDPARAGLAAALPRCAVPPAVERDVRPPDTGTVDPDQLAYVIYTSGSSGRPKGVQISHASLARHVSAVIAQYGLTAADRVLQFASPSFDVAVEELFPTWCAGARVVVPPAEPAGPDGSIEQFTRLVDDAAITVLNLPASYWQSWLVALGDPGTAVPRSLRLMIAGSEPVSAADVARWRALAPPTIRLVTAYGVTEATITATIHPAQGSLDEQPLDPGRPVAIGAPLPGTEAFVLDDRLGLAPIGVVGELYLGGPGLARGYLGQPALTAERFVPHPFSDVPGARLYRTGDRARVRRDGSLELLGRSDDQIKLRGYRIEPAEIEAALLEHPRIAACAVVARALAGGRQLVAYAVGDVDLGELRAHLQQRLPAHMVPARILALPALPLLPGGKVARAELPAPDDAVAARSYTPPRTPDEDLLAGLWGQLLGAQRVGRDDHFFELGGHSLLALQLVSRVRALWGIELPVRAVFEAPTLAGLAERLAGLRRATSIAGPPGPALEPAVRDALLPLSFAQERIWFLEQLGPEGAVFAMPYAVAIHGPLDAALLERCLGELIARHEALRTAFPPARDGAPRAEVAAALAVPLIRVDLADAANERAIDRAIDDFIAHEAQRRFDLAAGPLVRAHLVRVRATHHVLVIAMHHIVADGWSMAIVERELTALYDGHRRGAPSPLPALAVQYADFAIWQRRALHGEWLTGEIAWWREQLAGAPALLAFPFDRPRPATQSYRGAFQTRRLGPDVRDAVRALARAHEATAFMALLTGFQTLLGRLSGEDDLVIGTPVAGRDQLRTEHVVGCFANVLALRVQLSGDPSFGEALARTRRSCLATYAHQRLPFEQLVEALAPERSLSWHPIFQVMFTHHPEPAPSQLAPGVALVPLAVRTGAAKVDLALATAELPDGLELTLEYSSDLFDDATIARMLDQLEVLIDHATRAPGERLSRLRLVTTAERALLVQRWNTTAAPQAPGAVHDRFARQAAHAGDRTALIHGDARLSYGELDRRATRLAGALRRCGVGPEVLVGVCLPRSFDLVVAVLGVLKAGGAYLPLDPDHPTARLAWQLDDAAAPVVVTHDALRSKLGDYGGATLCLDREPQPDDPGALAGSRPIRPDQLAYVIYTSGSTGRPKGVQIAHGGVANVIDYSVRRFSITPDDAVLALAPLGFDASVLELFSALTSGAAAVLLPPSAVGSALEIARLLEVHAVTVIAATPSLLDALPERAYPRLRAVIAGGESCPARVARRWATGRRLYNAYAPTEATIYATLHEVAGEPGAPGVGLPIANMEAYVLDRHLEPVPIGVAGELYLGGQGLMRGYRNDPALTAERLVPHPFSDQPGARLYRTGDLARRRPDGTLEFAGRTDRQIKLRGYRIELGEIEAVLVAHPAIREAVVVVREDNPGVRYLAAYVIPASRSACPAAGDLARHVAQRVPAYMVPTAIIALDALPLRSSGKLDGSALPAPELTAGEARTAPVTPVERAVAEVFAEVLGRPADALGVDDNFFALGGNSLLATGVVSRLREHYGSEVSVRTLFEAPTIRQLADAMVALELAAADADELARLAAELGLSPKGPP
jgi:amino acid adenylation domain-containing protein